MFYDTLHLWQPIEEVKGFSCDNVLGALNGVRETKEVGKNPYYNGYLGNIKVSVNDTGISLKGSVAKYYNGNNLEPFTLTQTKEAFEKISDILHLKMDSAKCTRLDFEACLKVDYPVKYYLSMLLKCGRYERCEYYSSLYYKLTGEQRELIFYDKIKEMRAKDYNSVPAEYKNKNVLRFGVHYLKSIGKRLKEKGQDVYVSDLVDMSFYNSLQDKYLKEYESINKAKFSII